VVFGNICAVASILVPTPFFFRRDPALAGGGLSILREYLYLRG